MTRPGHGALWQVPARRYQRRVGASGAVNGVRAPWQPRWFRDITVLMSRQSATPSKRRGPPATGKGEPILVRLQPTPLADLDRWIARQDDQLSRPEAIRRLVELALAGMQPPKPRGPKARSKALDLATSASAEERQQRRRL